MIWVWIRRVLRYILMFFIPPKQEVPESKIDLNQQCFSCGHRTVVVETVTVTSKPGDVNAVRKARLVLTCKTCGAYVYRTPLAGDNPDLIHGREVTGI
jgi:ribosomal protein L44E